MLKYWACDVSSALLMTGSIDGRPSSGCEGTFRSVQHHSKLSTLLQLLPQDHLQRFDVHLTLRLHQCQLTCQSICNRGAASKLSSLAAICTAATAFMHSTAHTEHCTCSTPYSFTS